MKRTKVDSSSIASIGYDSDKRLLEVEFLKGGVYSYYPVTEEGYRELVNAESIGSFFHQNIKNNQNITCTKIK